MFESQTFDLVISDVIMPEMTGPELISISRQARDDFAVLFVTGYVGEGETDDLSATSCCGSRSPSARWPMRSPPR